MKRDRGRYSWLRSTRGRVAVVLIVAVLGVLLLSGIYLLRPTCHILWTWYNDPPLAAASPVGTVNDASRLNQTTVTETLPVPADPVEAVEQLRALLRRARTENLKVAIAGARHSMGGHTIYPGGVAVDMLPFNRMSLDTETDILHVGSGARWSEILPYLNQHGKSVAVMQSNNSFSIGGSISVNCHGWQTGKPPICSTVESFSLMLHDGTVTTCSRTQNQELFSLALGGYGLFGIILDVDLRVVPNEMLRLKQTRITINDYVEAHNRATSSDARPALAYGRLDVTADNLLDNGLLNVWSTAPGHTVTTTAPLGRITMGQVRRAIFRGSVGDAYGKRLRWWAEQDLEPLIGSEISTRNDLLNVGVELFENRSATDTDILHEYFVPPAQFASFVEAARTIISEHKADLLNVTVRDVEPDTDTFLRYADQRMLCLVMLFNQQKTPAAEQQMEALTQDLITAALSSNGRYYLTYRLHGTPSQIRKAYPRLDEFFALKRKYDPAELFQNEFYRKYASGAR